MTDTQPAFLTEIAVQGGGIVEKEEWVENSFQG